MKIEDIQALCTDEAILMTEHLRLRMRERSIRYADIKQAIMDGEIIEDYPDDFPHPSCLLFGNQLHIVCSIGDGTLFIITAYRPSAEKWEADNRTRKERNP